MHGFPTRGDVAFSLAKNPFHDRVYERNRADEERIFLFRIAPPFGKPLSGS
jgi:hypothetical protein